MMDANKTHYRQWSATYSKLPLFFYPWWLDAVCGPEGWGVVLVKNANGAVEGVLPYHQYRRWGRPWIGMPMLTPYLGPLLLYPKKISAPQRYAFEKRVMQDLIDQLPSFFYFQQNWTPRIDNWLPFFWKGFQQTTYYTYLFPDLGQPDKLFSRFKSATRNHIRVAARKYRISEQGSLADFFSLNEQTFQAQRKSVPYSFEFLKKIDELLQPRSWCRLYLAVADTDRCEAGIYVVRDRHVAYLLASGRHPDSHSGAVPLLIWQALQDLSGEVRQFDFEGSILPGVETFFRSFGAQLTPYYQVRKGKYRWVEGLKVIFEKRIRDRS